MKQLNLLPFSHPTVLRRLVRAMNANRAGVYLSGAVAGTTHNPRLLGPAKLRGEKEIVFPVTRGESAFIVTAGMVTEDTFFCGGSGKSITVSRLP